MSGRRPWRAWLLGVAASGALLAGCSSGGGSDGPRRFRYAEAVVVPAAVAEREKLAELLAGFAQKNGLYYHDTTPGAQLRSNGRQTIALEVQRPTTNSRPWSEIHVSAVGNGAALMTFAAPLDDGIAADAARGRSELLSALRQQWPGTLAVPLLPDGGIPRQNDLRLTPRGLRIDRAKASEYGLAQTSPLLTQ